MKLKKLQAWFEVLAWNQAHPVGTYVEYDSVIRQLGVSIWQTRSSAAVISQDSAVVWITGHPGAVNLRALRVLDAAEVAAIAGVNLRGFLPFWLFLPEHPRMPAHELAVDFVYSGRLDTHAVNLTMLAGCVSERKDHVGALLKAEIIEQISDVFSRDDALDVPIVHE